MSASSPSQTVFSIGYDLHAGNGTPASDTDNGGTMNSPVTPCSEAKTFANARITGEEVRLEVPLWRRLLGYLS